VQDADGFISPFFLLNLTKPKIKIALTYLQNIRILFAPENKDKSLRRKCGSGQEKSRLSRRRKPNRGTFLKMQAGYSGFFYALWFLS
jgi:hypothetical protein